MQSTSFSAIIITGAFRFPVMTCGMIDGHRLCKPIEKRDTEC
jgi:hypothetical protein